MQKRLLVLAMVISVAFANACGPRPIASGKVLRVVHARKDGDVTTTMKWEDGTVEVFQDVVVVTNPAGEKYVAPRSEFTVLEMK